MSCDPAIIAVAVAPAVTMVFGYWLGKRHKGQELAWWVVAERQERAKADTDARQAEAAERKAKRRIGEQVCQERRARMFGESR